MMIVVVMLFSQWKTFGPRRFLLSTAWWTGITEYVHNDSLSFLPAAFVWGEEVDKCSSLSVQICSQLKFWMINYGWVYLRGLRWLLSDLCYVRLWKGCLEKRKSWIIHRPVCGMGRQPWPTYYKHFPFCQRQWRVIGNVRSHTPEEAGVLLNSYSSIVLYTFLTRDLHFVSVFLYSIEVQFIQGEEWIK